MQSRREKDATLSLNVYKSKRQTASMSSSSSGAAASAASAILSFSEFQSQFALGNVSFDMYVAYFNYIVSKYDFSTNSAPFSKEAIGELLIRMRFKSFCIQNVASGLYGKLYRACLDDPAKAYLLQQDEKARNGEAVDSPSERQRILADKVKQCMSSSSICFAYKIPFMRPQQDISKFYDLDYTEFFIQRRLNEVLLNIKPFYSPQNLDLVPKARAFLAYTPYTFETTTDSLGAIAETMKGQKFPDPCHTLVMDYLKDSTTLYNFYKEACDDFLPMSAAKEESFRKIVAQVLLFNIASGAKLPGFQHLDLHMGNILISNPQAKQLLEIDLTDERVSIDILPSNYQIRVVDFGLSYCDEALANPATSKSYAANTVYYSQGYDTLRSCGTMIDFTKFLGTMINETFIKYIQQDVNFSKDQNKWLLPLYDFAIGVMINGNKQESSKISRSSPTFVRNLIQYLRRGFAYILPPYYQYAIDGSYEVSITDSNNVTRVEKIDWTSTTQERMIAYRFYTTILNVLLYYKVITAAQRQSYSLSLDMDTWTLPSSGFAMQPYCFPVSNMLEFHEMPNKTRIPVVKLMPGYKEYFKAPLSSIFKLRFLKGVLKFEKLADIAAAQAAAKAAREAERAAGTKRRERERDEEEEAEEDFLSETEDEEYIDEGENKRMKEAEDAASGAASASSNAAASLNPAAALSLLNAEARRIEAEGAAAPLPTSQSGAYLQQILSLASGPATATAAVPVSLAATTAATAAAFPVSLAAVSNAVTAPLSLPVSGAAAPIADADALAAQQSGIQLTFQQPAGTATPIRPSNPQAKQDEQCTIM